MIHIIKQTQNTMNKQLEENMLYGEIGAGIVLKQCSN